MGRMTMDILVDYLLTSAVERLPEPLRERYDEEWRDHRTHVRGLRALWWALWLRMTAARTAAAWQDARLPRSD
jgi:hypothetical protein